MFTSLLSYYLKIYGLLVEVVIVVRRGEQNTQEGVRDGVPELPS